MKNRLSEEEFEEIYKPQQNHIVGGENAPFNGWMFETYGPELEYILSLANNPDTAKRVWTILEGEGNSLCYSTGYHLVNRLGYLVTEMPYENELQWVELDFD